MGYYSASEVMDDLTDLFTGTIKLLDGVINIVNTPVILKIENNDDFDAAFTPFRTGFPNTISFNPRMAAKFVAVLEDTEFSIDEDIENYEFEHITYRSYMLMVYGAINCLLKLDAAPEVTDEIINLNSLDIAVNYANDIIKMFDRTIGANWDFRTSGIDELSSVIINIKKNNARTIINPYEVYTNRTPLQHIIMTLRKYMLSDTAYAIKESPEDVADNIIAAVTNMYESGGALILAHGEYELLVFTENTMMCCINHFNRFINKRIIAHESKVEANGGDDETIYEDIVVYESKINSFVGGKDQLDAIKIEFVDVNL